MLEATFAGVVTFAVTWLVVMGLELALHRLTHNRSRLYRPGVWVFSVLAGLAAVVEFVGR